MRAAPGGSVPTGWIETAASGIDVDAVSAKVTFEPAFTERWDMFAFVGDAQETDEPARACAAGVMSRSAADAAATRATRNGCMNGKVAWSSDTRRISEYRGLRRNGGRPEGPPAVYPRVSR